MTGHAQSRLLAAQTITPDQYHAIRQLADPNKDSLPDKTLIVQSKLCANHSARGGFVGQIEPLIHRPRG
jgi:hypothetical protein